MCSKKKKRKSRGRGRTLSMCIFVLYIFTRNPRARARAGLHRLFWQGFQSEFQWDVRRRNISFLYKLLYLYKSWIIPLRVSISINNQLTSISFTRFSFYLSFFCPLGQPVWPQSNSFHDLSELTYATSKGSHMSVGVSAVYKILYIYIYIYIYIY